MVKILIIEDNQANISMIEKLLRSSGYFNIMSTSDFGETLKVFKEYKPDLILLDLQMTNIDGFKVIEQLNEVKEDEYLSLVVITANNEQANRLRALTMGAKDFIAKPFDYTEVLMRIRITLEVRFLHAEIKENKRLLENKVQVGRKEV
ncbi:response regulator [Desulfosporosinus fructosivorans]|uniref:Stage 0 sporulation protein A homolog n=1 Tax=Desulfosporosinus fructosivorans TaxID=2018669 RepID=A0A4Z0R788_9FIRM|nr:response regulator [Desulfosporosinus fructosivorans]TGE39031.1 response regulator [Desulfosporosinus fructosivorans]